MAFGIDGLSSGLDTTTIINQLIQLERAPATRMERTKVANTQAITALGGLRTSLGAITEAARALGSATATFVPRVARSTSTAVTATAGPLAATGTVDLTVDRLAATHSLVTGEAASRDAVVAGTGDRTVTLSIGGTDHQLAVTAGTTLTELAAQIEDAGLGVRASLVDTGSGTRLQLTSRTSGAAGTFTADLSGLDAAAFGGSTATAVLSQGQDAKVTVGTGPGAYAVTSATNTFNGLLDGLSLTVSAADPAKVVTVTVDEDVSGTVDRVKAFVEKVNSTLSELDRQLRTSLNGATPGALAGDSGIRGLRDRLVEAVTRPIAGAALGASGTVGLMSTREGRLELDETKLREALAADPAAVEELFRTADPGPGIAERVTGVVEDATLAGTGLLATMQKSRESANKTLTDSIEAIDRRVELRRQGLVRQFSALEVAMGQMQAQQSWMSSQIGSMNANSAA